MMEEIDTGGRTADAFIETLSKARTMDFKDLIVHSECSSTHTLRIVSCVPSVS